MLQVQQMPKSTTAKGAYAASNKAAAANPGDINTASAPAATTLVRRPSMVVYNARKRIEDGGTGVEQAQALGKAKVNSMRLEDYFDLIGPDDIRIRGTRVGIETVLYDYIHRGHAPEEIAQSYPVLELEQIYATITYYLHDKARISQYLARWLEHGHRMREEQRQNPTAAMLKLWAARVSRAGARHKKEQTTSK
jgi:uncharacterized protein (DUF433 family)